MQTNNYSISWSETVKLQNPGFNRTVRSAIVGNIEFGNAKVEDTYLILSQICIVSSFLPPTCSEGLWEFLSLL